MIDYRVPLDELPDPLPIVPLEKPFDVTIRPPGSKSITNRAYVLAALAEGESRIMRPLRADDTDLLLDALCTLGAEARWEGDNVLITGVNGRFPRGGSVNLGDGGTPTRFMIAAACLAAEPVVVDGSTRMRERPIAEGVDLLRRLGASIEYMEEDGRLPVRVSPSRRFPRMHSINIGRTASSQFISALMLIAAVMPRGLRFVFGATPTSEAYIALTDEVLDAWIVGVERLKNGLKVHPANLFLAIDFGVPSDASSAAYWFLAAAISPGSAVRIEDFALYPAQPDCEFLTVLADAGAAVEFKSSRVSGENCLRAVRGDYSQLPDASMCAAVAAAVSEGVSHLTGLRTLRVKETDRLAALANELRKVGCEVTTTEDSITITPPPIIDAASDDRREEDADVRAAEVALDAASGSSSLRSSDPASRSSDPASIVIETYNDHRMAMSFAILGLVRPGISIRNPRCVAKSYPTFWQDFAKLYR